MTAFWTQPRSAQWDDYWRSLDAPHRDAILHALEALPPFSSLLEICCGPGVNLWRILEAFPDVDLTGIDVSEEAIENGLARFGSPDATHLYTGSGRVALCPAPIPEALSPDAQPALEQVDVCLSVYALAYVDPRLLGETLASLSRLARHALILAEPMATPQAPPAKLSNLPEWRHDYLRWFLEAAPGWKVTTFSPLRVDHMNRLLVAQRL
jgi:SAM-dependent methyltransferase